VEILREKITHRIFLILRKNKNKTQQHQGYENKNLVNFLRNENLKKKQTHAHTQGNSTGTN
jgi:hypothetical protein